MRRPPHRGGRPGAAAWATSTARRSVDGRGAEVECGGGPGMIVAMGRDEADLGRKAADLADRLPEALAPLARIAFNYRWCWYPDGKDVFRSIDEGRWEVCGENPV